MTTELGPTEKVIPEMVMAVGGAARRPWGKGMTVPAKEIPLGPMVTTFPSGIVMEVGVAMLSVWPLTTIVPSGLIV